MIKINFYKDSLLKMSNGVQINQNILDFVATNIHQTTYFTHEKFCAECQCTRTQLEEFWEGIGASDFEDFQKILSNLMDVAHKEIDQKMPFNEEITDVLKTMSNIEINNIFAFKESLSPERLNRLLRDILNAPEVIMMGARTSNILVSYATSLLNKIGIRATNIDASDTNYFDKINNIDRSALIIAIGLSRYPKAIPVAMNFLKKKGFRIVAITDFPQSPLIPIAEYHFFVKINSYDFTDSYSTTLILINLIVIMISKINKEEVGKRIKEFDETANQLDYFL
ncbi:MAG: SIS domain-containing protein [Smithellaceae bacterium]|nr:SIS domain-containing protein [Smithellaceae bacterium]